MKNDGEKSLEVLSDSVSISPSSIFNISVTDMVNAGIAGAFKMPGVKINRMEYLGECAFGKYFCANDLVKIYSTSPIQAGVPANLLHKLAEDAIAYEKHLAAITSTGFGAAGVAGIIPDLAQYYAHVFRIIQKLAYLYGWPELTNCENQLDDEFKDIILSFMGVMLAVKGANTAIIGFSEAFGKHVAKQIGEGAMLKNATAALVKIAEKVGIQLSQKLAGELAKKAIPVVGGLISGAFTWVMFDEEASNLHKFLAENPYGSVGKYTLAPIDK